MFLADVIGTVVSPVAIPLLASRTLLLLRPVDPTGRPYGVVRVGIDTVQAGVGDRVVVLDEGNSARQVLAAPDGAVKTIVIGVVDFIEIDRKLVYEASSSMPVPRSSRA